MFDTIGYEIPLATSLVDKLHWADSLNNPPLNHMGESMEMC